MCSTATEDLENNDDAFNVQTVNFKELSSYVCKDDVGCDKDTPFLLCIAKELGDDFT